ncbi:proprotein convertase subtilisin/kexin type 5 [Esox lucius]|uniref:proprotein convertase subtilisin/kexin type 5 n=1 Tax=Esox lucius TaxID=8010 RepID=UPI001476B04D|nr:proprotein convertase subtilisin/kexin type 5 [Esox lucius]
MRCSEASPDCPSHMNIEAAWGRGPTGKGVVVSILDDGIEREHPDLRPNYDSFASYDVNGNDDDPTPRYDSSTENSHGTKCAGMVAAAANNSRCSVGISFDAQIGGIRMLDGDVTDLVEAQSLSFRQQHIDIYSASWGPEDDGVTVEGPGPLARRALENGIRTGRKGRGSIFVWASGNGGLNGDHCSCDGYASSIYTISISSTTQSGTRPDYLEPCPSTLASTYSPSATDSDGARMVTLDLKQGCSKEHSGTSFSAPIAAGVIALLLEANPLVTWRDVQHIIVRTSQARRVMAPDWHANGAGYQVSHFHGFGLLDAENMVKEAERWRLVPSQHMCEEAPIQHSRIISPGLVLRSVHESTGCSRHPLQRVVYLEHVVIRVTVSHSHRGDLSITVRSPAGTKSQLLAPRPLDHSNEGFKNWEFMTTHCWGEKAAGEWSLEILDTPSQQRDNSEPGELKGWSLVLFGTSEHPYSMRREQARSAELPTEGGDLTEEYSGSCDLECSEDGCEGPGPEKCVTCLHFFLKFKNNTRTCVSACPPGFWGDRHRCKKCFASCESCTGSRSDQCTACQPTHHLTLGTNSCTASCADGYYLDHDMNMCRKCSENCLRCTSANICTECQAGTSLLGNRCQRSCVPGSYLNEQEGTCEPCHEACATCAGAGVEACNQCADGYLIEEWRCVFSCSAGFYATESSPRRTGDGPGMCRRCDASCLTCVGAGKEDCSSCPSGHSLRDGVCVVSTACGDGEYQDGHGKCYACDTTCLKCTGPSTEDCISCIPSRFLDEGRCVAQCSEGRYQSDGQCHLCDHTCATCSESGPANCTSCDTDKFNMDRYLYKESCVHTCPEAYFHTQEKSCEACPDNCQLCTSASHCLRCNSSHYTSNGVCIRLECGEGEVEDPDYDDCMACEEGCMKCVLYNPRHCLSCTGGFYKFQDGCYKNCPAKTYSVEDQMTCVPCDEKCVSCDEHECYWCETDLFLSEGKCVTECPEGFYGDEDTQECEECHSECATCNGPDSDNCVSCVGGKSAEEGECVIERDSCPEKTFHTDDGECQACHASCESCSGEGKNQCRTCVKGHFLTTERVCVLKCPAGSFASRLSGACEVCPQGCVQCVDAQHCTRCHLVRKAPLYLQDGQCVHQCQRGYPAGQMCRSCAPGCTSCAKNATHCLSCVEPLLLHKHQCVETCPPVHLLRDGECLRCPTACQECTTGSQCTRCEEYHFLYEDRCVMDCPERFFKDSIRGTCARCHPDCGLCDGPDGDDCDSCSDPEATLHNGACLPDCPSHTYRDSRTSVCKDCDGSCLTCTGPHAGSCSSCTAGQRLDGHRHCVSLGNSCTPRRYADQNGECLPCHKYCQECYGPGPRQCLSCNQNHFLLNGSCVDVCPTGFYQEESGQRCEACHPACLTCVGRHTHECLSCQDHLFREGKECVVTCQPSHYGNVASRTCEKCDPSCGECSGGGADGCLSCVEGLLYLRRQGRCYPSCPQGLYHDSRHHTCEPCHASCRTCSGKGSQECDTCHDGHTLSDGMCESLCNMGQYPLVQPVSLWSSGQDCEDCDSSCLDCWGPGPYNCTICPAHAILTAGGRCLLCCQNDPPVERDSRAPQKECCNCTETRGECVLSTNLAFRNDELETPENMALFITTSILLLLGLGTIVFLVRHSRSKSPSLPDPITAPRGYEKLGGGWHGGGRNTTSTGHATSSGHFHEAQLVDLTNCGAGEDKNEDEDDEDEDIVYMGQDGTVYRKFRYGHPEDDNDDGLEYDDESYTFR